MQEPPAAEPAADEPALEAELELERSQERIAALRRRVAACEGAAATHLAQDPRTAGAPSHAALPEAALAGQLPTLEQWYQLSAADDPAAAAAAVDARARAALGAPPAEAERWYNLADAADRAAFSTAASDERMEQVAEDLLDQKRKLVEKTVGSTLSRAQLQAQLAGGGSQAQTAAGETSGGSGGAAGGRRSASHAAVSRQF